MDKEPADKVDDDRTITSERDTAMQIFIFKSATRPDLHAFNGDLAGNRMPERFSPWHAIGTVAPDRDPPHELLRDVIETAIEAQGFQFCRMSKSELRRPSAAQAAFDRMT
jgi:hypothetical protein